MRLITRLFAPLAALAALFAPALAEARQAPSFAPVANAPAPKPVKAHPALWKVADADTTIYLFGTIHLLPDGIEWFSGPLADAFAHSDELVTEIPKVPDDETGAMLLKHATLPSGENLRAGMSDAERARFDAALSAQGLPPATLDHYKPWFAAMTLATLPLRRRGFELEHGIESELDARNAALGRPRSGLETLDFQLGMFDALDPAVQRKYLFEVIDALPTFDKDIAEIIASWTAGDAAKLAEELNAENDDPALVEALLLKRNRAWAQWIRQRLDKPGTIFVAVGAGHLGGKGSVQDQLEQAGIHASRVQ